MQSTIEELLSTPKEDSNASYFKEQKTLIETIALLRKEAAEQNKKSEAVIQQLKEEIAAKQEKDDQRKNELDSNKFKQPKAICCQIF